MRTKLFTVGVLAASATGMALLLPTAGATAAPPSPVTPAGGGCTVLAGALHVMEGTGAGTMTFTSSAKVAPGSEAGTSSGTLTSSAVAVVAGPAPAGAPSGAIFCSAIVSAPDQR